MNASTGTDGPGGPLPNIFSAIDAENDFREAMRRRGLILPDKLIADGKIHRSEAEGKHGKGDGSYLLHLDGFPAGGFENHRDGIGWEKWRARGVRGLSPKDRAAHKARMEAARREHEADRAKRQAEAQEEAARIWADAEPCESHPYLTRKGVRPYGVRVDGDRLVVQVRDTEKVLHSLQFIDGDGNKLFLTGGRKKGCYHAMGKAADAEVIYIAEGYATAASVHEAMGGAVAAAFDCGNLRLVAEALRAKYPDARIILCADDDYRRENNPGLTHATEAAQAVGGLVAVPTFGENRREGATDFNDLHQAQGLEAVRSCMEAAAAPEAQDATPAGRVVTYPYNGGQFRVDDDGVWFDPPGKDDSDAQDPPRWLCSRLDVLAMTRDGRSEEWGRLLSWKDVDGNEHTWPMPAELLAGDCGDARRELLRRGVQIAPTLASRNLLTAYLTVSRPAARARCVDRVGWCGGQYVLPDFVIGDGDETVCYQRASAVESAFAIRGTVDEWRDSLAALAVGNSRLVFAISAAFAGSLADLAGEDGGGFHFRGGSSGGKTTALRMAASVWGAPAVYVRTWRATANGLEAVAALHNDGLLLLDELGQIDPREAGGAAYLLANGHGKARASVTGAARRAARWRLLFLSAGEQSLASLVAEGGKRAHAGQEIRLADVDADAGAGMGIVEQLNGHASPAALVDAIRDAAARNYGSAGIEWLRRLVPDRAKIANHVVANVTQVAAELAPVGASGQAERVARRFALVAVAGEMATAYGLTGWPEDESVTAAGRCFGAWLAGFGGGVGRREDAAILAHVRGFIEAHGQSRFQQWDAGDTQKVIDRAGFWRGVEGERRYYILTETFRRELCTGFDLRDVVRVLKAAGALEPGGDGKTTRRERLPGIGLARCYVLTPRVWEGEE